MIFNDYNNAYDEFIGSYPLNNCNKISGNIFAQTLRKYIKNIINNTYEVSELNVYIKGSNIEWDMLILKKNISNKEKAYNIFNPENVVCAIEFKTSGLMTSNITFVQNYFKTRIEELENLNKEIKFAYISLCEIPKIIEYLKLNYKDNCFWLIEGYYRSRNKSDTKLNDYMELEIYLKNLLLNVVKI